MDKKFLPRNICIGAIEQASLYNNFTIFLKHLVMNMDQILGSSSWFTNKLGRKWVIHGIKDNKANNICCFICL